MGERSGRQDVTERKRPEGLARLASEASATTESGGEAESQAGSGTGVGRDAKLTERSRGLTAERSVCREVESMCSI
jgi:hypothetical protein